MQLSSITHATLHDAAEIVALVNSAYRGEEAKKGWTTEADLLSGQRIDQSMLTEQFNKPGAVILKYCNAANKIVGCVALEPEDNNLYLGMFSVSPAEQAKGIGKQLLAASEQYAKNNNYQAIVMTVISVREELIAWYQRHGYTPTGEIKPFHAGEEFGIAKQPLVLNVLKKTI
jgi:ribosomal protein S18 acetylase RimI-like enzyme